MFHMEVAADAAIETRRAEPNISTRTALEADSLRKTVRVAQARMFQFVALPTASSIEALIKDRQGLPPRAAWDVAKELMKEKEDLEITPPPSELVGYARACQSWLEDLLRSAAPQGQCDEATDQVVALYQQALDGSAGAAARDLESRLTTFTNYGYFIIRFLEKGRASAERLDEFRRQLEAIRKGMDRLQSANVQSPAIEAKWFEVEGDRIASPDGAALHYRRGTVNAPFYYTCWVKFAGTRCQQGVPITRVVEEIADMPIEIQPKLHAWAQNQPLPIRSGLDRAWIPDLWRVGTKVIGHLAEE